MSLLRAYAYQTMLALLLAALAVASQASDPALTRDPQAGLRGPVVGMLPDGRVLLPTNQILSDPRRFGVRRRFVSGLPGQGVQDRPVDLVLSPDGRWLAAACNSGTALLAAAGDRPAQFFPCQAGNIAGVAFSADGRRVYASLLRENAVRVLRLDGERWAEERDGRIALPENSAPAGLAVSRDGQRLYVALSTDRDQLGSLGVVDLPGGKLAARVRVGSYPFAVCLSLDGARLYVANRAGRAPRAGDTLQMLNPAKSAAANPLPIVVDPKTGIAQEGSVSILDTRTLTVRAEVRVGRLPSLMALDAERGRLFVPNSNDDTVSLIDTRQERVIQTLPVKPLAGLPFSSGPCAAAVSADGERLFVANGGNNAIVVCSLRGGRMRAEGFMPVDWYPCALAVSRDGRTIYALNNKGIGSVGPVVAGEPRPRAPRYVKEHTGTLLEVPLPNADRLAAMTLAVEENNNLREVIRLRERVSRGGATAVIPARRGQRSPIRYLFYVLKENQTYDAILGDLKDAAGRPFGNGDPSLAIFGEGSPACRGASVSPNHHALASAFVVLDNFYACPSRSSDGHQWALQAYSVDTNEREVSHLLRGDPSDGTVPTGYASSGFLWDLCRRNRVSFRIYGEYTQYAKNGTFTDHLRDHRAGTMRFPLTSLSPINGLAAGRDYPTDYPGFGGDVPDQTRVDAFAREFASICASKRPLARLNIVYLPNDHGSGTGDPTRPTPRSAIADNDLALGRLVDLISRSRFWRESAILVVEDDSQNDTDHVEGHRTLALCISPYARRGVVDGSTYTQVSMVRTIEAILGLPPMTQIDAATPPMTASFIDLAAGEQPDFSLPLPGGPLVPSVALDELNPPRNALRGATRLWAERSARLDWSRPDVNDDEIMRRISWYSVNGFARPFPGDPRVTFLPR